MNQPPSPAGRSSRGGRPDLPLLLALLAAVLRLDLFLTRFGLDLLPAAELVVAAPARRACSAGWRRLPTRSLFPSVSVGAPPRIVRDAPPRPNVPSPPSARSLSRREGR